MAGEEIDRLLAEADADREPEPPSPSVSVVPSGSAGPSVEECNRAADGDSAELEPPALSFAPSTASLELDLGTSVEERSALALAPAGDEPAPLPIDGSVFEEVGDAPTGPATADAEGVGVGDG